MAAVKNITMTSYILAITLDHKCEAQQVVFIKLIIKLAMVSAAVTKLKSTFTSGVPQIQKL